MEHIPPSGGVGKSDSDGVLHKRRSICGLPGGHKGSNLAQLAVFQRDRDFSGRHTTHHTTSHCLPFRMSWACLWAGSGPSATTMIRTTGAGSRKRCSTSSPNTRRCRRAARSRYNEVRMRAARNLLDTLILWLFSMAFESAVFLLGRLRPSPKAPKR